MLSSTTTSSQLLDFGLSGWDHTLDQPGPTATGTVLAPSITANVPEPNSVVLLLSGMFFLRFAKPRKGLSKSLQFPGDAEPWA